jgi:tripartite-type tricarboxylate transporter receptor subunit TctC
VRAGKLKALGVSSSKRSAIAPDVPTIAESGLPGFEAMSWFGLYAPAGVPKDIVNKVNAEVVRILHLADVKEKLAQQGAEPGAMNAAEFDAFLRAEMVKWAKAVKDSGARAD